MPHIDRDDYEPETPTESGERKAETDALESTDIDADEVRDGDVDAEGASAIPSRNR
jgi:hypothetical protein